MYATVIPLLKYDQKNYILWMSRQCRVKKLEGHESQPCMVYLVWITVFLCHGGSDEVCPLHSGLCVFRSSPKNALQRFTKPTTVRP